MKDNTVKNILEVIVMKNWKKYLIYGWYGTELLTAKELYERVMIDAQRSNYNWIASATELVRVCSKRGFPLEYAKDIKMAILKCFAEVDMLYDEYSYREPTDNEAVQHCFNSLSWDIEDECSAKQEYLKARIKLARIYSCEFLIYCGDEFKKFCDEWERRQFEKYFKQENIDFLKMFKELCDDFGKELAIADKQKKFKSVFDMSQYLINSLWDIPYQGDNCVR